MRRMPAQCPSCGGNLIITELSCTTCDTVVRGRYSGCAFCQLTDENLRFLEIFVSCRGNVKEMERETGLGYWTIRSRLDGVIESLRLNLETQAPASDLASQRRAILASVDSGELSVEEAEQMLTALARRQATGD